MDNIFIIGIVALLTGVGLVFTVKHFKGQSSCCGTGGPEVKAEVKKLDQVIMTKTIVIEGMHCNHCKKWVEESINALDGAAAVVNLEKKTAVVSLAKEVSDKVLANAVIKAGYKVIEIR